MILSRCMVGKGALWRVTYRSQQASHITYPSLLPIPHPELWFYPVCLSLWTFLLIPTGLSLTLPIPTLSTCSISLHHNMLPSLSCTLPAYPSTFPSTLFPTYPSPQYTSPSLSLLLPAYPSTIPSIPYLSLLPISPLDIHLPDYPPCVSPPLPTPLPAYPSPCLSIPLPIPPPAYLLPCLFLFLTIPPPAYPSPSLALHLPSPPPIYTSSACLSLPLSTHSLPILPPSYSLCLSLTLPIRLPVYHFLPMPIPLCVSLTLIPTAPPTIPLFLFIPHLSYQIICSFI